MINMSNNRHVTYIVLFVHDGTDLWQDQKRLLSAIFFLTVKLTVLSKVRSKIGCPTIAFETNPHGIK